MNNIFRIIIIFICVSSFSDSFGQIIRVNVKDTNNNVLIGAQVKLTKLQDSSKSYCVTDISGIALFKGIFSGSYKIMISYVGYQTLKDTISITSAQNDFEFRLKDNSIQMGEAVVTAKKPLIRQEDDKMIIDPMPLVSTSTNALEVLEKTPGIYVDQDGGIYITSASPAAIYINGREQKMSAQDVTTLLKSLPPGSIEKIEVMRTPSTKYDASTSGGIINIILKKGINIGRSGAINTGMNQGKYGNRFAGFNINNSVSKSTSYLNMNYNHNGLLEEINTIRLLSPDTSIHQSSCSKQQSEQAYMGYGISYDVSKKTTLSYDGRINLSFPGSSAQNNNLIKNAKDIVLADGNNEITNNSDIINLQQDMDFTRKLDTAGSDWETKFSYSFNSNKLSQDYLTSYSYPVNILKQGNGDNLQKRHYFLFQSDMTYFFSVKIKLETGIQSTYQDYNSKADYFLFQNDSNILDPERTNAFSYRENINAAYAQASKTFGRLFTLKAGGRMEQTYMKGHQTIPSDTSFIIKRADWFPYIYISRKIIKKFGIELTGYLIYRKTITRPGYQSLNPFIKYIDEFLYEVGNPALKPQFTDNIEANISFDDMPVFAIGQNYTRDIFSSVTYKDKTHDNVAVRTYDNLGKNKETYIRGMAGIPPGGKYFFAIGAQYNINEYTGIYENQYLNYKRGSWRFFTFHSINLFKQTKLTMFGFMLVNGLQNFYELKNFGQMNFGLTQTLFKKKLTVTINGRDVLKTMITKFSLDQGSILTTGDRYSDNQRFGINIRYNFGIRKKDEFKRLMPNDIEE
jgi:hypothetical protein